MKKIFLLILIASFCQATSGQTLYRHKIAVFTPLYLDSVFDAAGNFRFEKNNFPRYVLPGLEFYQGVQTALDSLQKRGAPLEVYVYDSRGNESMTKQLASPEISDAEMFIGQSNAIETKILAEAAEERKIPFISTTLPNDAGISSNPYFVVLNSTLQAHVEGIYRFVQKYHRADRIIVFRKPGGQEDQLQEHFTEFATSTTSTPLRIQFVDVGTDFTSRALQPYLDSTKRNLCIAGTLDESFGQKLALELASISSTYPLRVIGMPTWDRLNYTKLANLEIIYTTPFYYNRMSNLETRLADEYLNAVTSRPSDMFFRGYESMLRFGLLLLDTKKDVASNLTRKGNTVFTQFDIQPVFKDKSAMNLDYFENRHLYFIKVFGGVKNILN